MSTLNHDETAKQYGAFYQKYITAIQPDRHRTQRKPDLSNLDDLVHEHVIHNSKPLGLHGYKNLIRTNIIETKTYIRIEKLVVDVAEKTIAVRIVFTVPPTCTELVGYKFKGADDRVFVKADGERVKTPDGSFEVVEHVMYGLDDSGADRALKIRELWSVVDEQALKANSLDAK